VDIAPSATRAHAIWTAYHFGAFRKKSLVLKTAFGLISFIVAALPLLWHASKEPTWKLPTAVLV
jgi:hypothetical protein